MTEPRPAPEPLRAALERLRERGFSFYQVSDPCTNPTGLNELDAADLAGELASALQASPQPESRQPNSEALVWHYSGPCPNCGYVIEADLSALPPRDPPALDYAGWVERVAHALHEDCVLEWRGIAIVDPNRQITMHTDAAHLGQAHDLVRRLGLAAQPEVGSRRRRESSQP